MQSWDLPSAFHASVVPTINFLCIRGTFRRLPCVCGSFCQLRQLSVCARVHLLTFRASAGLSVNFHQLSVRPQDLPPTCVDSMFVSGTFSHFPLTICASMGPSKNVLCTCWTFRQLQATFRAVVGPSGNSQCGHRTFLQVASTFRAAVVPSATFHVVAGSSVNFSSSHGCSVNFHQLSVHQRDLPTTKGKFPCCHGTFHILSVQTRGPSVKLLQLSVLLRDLRQLSVRLRDSL